MKILAVCGSPRKGNTEAMLKRILDGAKGNGTEIELVLLRDKDIKLCDGLAQCENTHSCVIQDEMIPLYGKIFAADLIVLGSPTYFNNVSALMKNFIDRMNPFWEDERLKGKRVVLVSVGGQGGSSVKKCENAMREFCEICRMKVIDSLRAKADSQNQAQKNEKLMKKCFEFGKKLAERKN
ncbi:MAG: flavodoxin family protein [archaeon]|nr:flavodoxin family protein [Candidatus Micrarchaeota archaeon]